jgi:hypothetical protein
VPVGGNKQFGLRRCCTSHQSVEQSGCLIAYLFVAACHARQRGGTKLAIVALPVDALTFVCRSILADNPYLCADFRKTPRVSAQKKPLLIKSPSILMKSVRMCSAIEFAL